MYLIILDSSALLDLQLLCKKIEHLGVPVVFRVAIRLDEGM
jgi:hypothetical protein